MKCLSVYPDLNNQTFRLNRTNETKEQFIAETGERELMNKGLNKYITTFDYFDMALIVSSAISSKVLKFFGAVFIRVFCFLQLEWRMPNAFSMTLLTLDDKRKNVSTKVKCKKQSMPFF